MSQLLLDLPDSLRSQLERQAEREGITLQNYIAQLLTRLAAQSFVFDQMTSRYPQDQAEEALRQLLSSRQP